MQKGVTCNTEVLRTPQGKMLGKVCRKTYSTDFKFFSYSFCHRREFGKLRKICKHTCMSILGIYTAVRSPRFMTKTKSLYNIFLLKGVEKNKTKKKTSKKRHLTCYMSFFWVVQVLSWPSSHAQSLCGNCSSTHTPPVIIHHQKKPLVITILNFMTLRLP